MGVELRVDRIRCDGAGLCAELLPELVALDDWGYPMLRPGAVPEALLDHARRAVDACPVLAIRLEAARRPATTAAPRQAPTPPRWQSNGAGLVPEASDQPLAIRR
jgi:ferredoxin